jgi:alpha-L-rhamnosidase
MTATPATPTVEHHRSPIGIGERAPRLSWKVAGDPGWRQVAAEIEIVRNGEVRRWSLDTDQQVLVDWPDEPLGSREHASVRVRVRGADESWTAWSGSRELEAGLLEPGDWLAVPVGGAWPEDPDSDDRRPALVRREFEVGDGLVSARLYATAHGLYEAEINGQRVGDDALSPGWTVYPRRLRYYTYDVTELLAPAQRNAIGAWLGDGWYRGRLGWRGGFRNNFGFDQSFLAQLELTYADGRREVIATDAAWRASAGPIVRAGNYDGEEYDARLEQAGWSSPGFDDAMWTTVATRKRDPATLVAPQGPPVRCTEVIAPAAVLTSPSGRRIVDFGQNLVGRVRIRVSGEAGDRVTIRTAEVLQDGELYTRPLREARSTDRYVLAGRPSEEWEPRFTFHGFRYAEIEGWPGDLDAAAARGDLVAAVYHTDLERTGWFESSDAELNRLHENVVWSMRGNFVDVPTDCPQRDERVGWTGDLQVFAPTASFLYDVSGMLAGWLTDVAVEQLPDGTIPWYVPVIPAHHMWTPIRPGAAWGDVATFTPWTLFERFGDAGILRAQYESAQRWVDLQARLAGADRLWDHGFQLGDWLDPDAPAQDPAAGKTDRYLVATAYFAASARFVARMAQVIGRDEDAAGYERLADEVRTAFVTAYVRPDGTMTSDAQTAYALALAFDLLPEHLREPAGQRLAELVAASGNRISTGFVGTPLVADALSMTGRTAVAYDLLLERECPSWLYAVTMGATTIWERWDSMLPDGSVHPGTMTSFNHYALGAVADWMHRTVAGIAPDSPGYRRIRFAPRPGGGLTWAIAEHETPYGRAGISWRLDADRLEIEVTVPLGTSAVLDLPGEAEREIGPGVHRQVVAFASESRAGEIASDASAAIL